MTSIVELPISSQDALPVCLWKENPNRLVSLFDMVPILSTLLNDLYIEYETVDRVIVEAQKARDNSTLTQEESKKLTDWLSKMAKLVDACEFRTATHRIGTMELLLKRDCTVKSFREQFRELGWSIGIDSDEKTFLYVTKEEAKYYEQDKLFGERVYLNLPSGRQDIRDAGTCLAAGLGTASVFHLMRAAERGMRILARDRRVRFKNDTPLELQVWEDIIKAVENEVNKIQQWSNRRGLAKTQALEFYNNALAEFRGFKGAWRNHVSHARDPYTIDDAKAVLLHVERFLKLLATRLTESSRTPKVWTSAQVIQKEQGHETGND